MADDVDFVAGLDEFEPFADLQFLFGGVIDQTVDALAAAFDFLMKQFVLVLELLNLMLFFDKRRKAARSS